MKVVFDTSALLLLAAGKILDLVVEAIDCIIPERVKSEIIGISKNKNLEGNLAKSVIDYFDKGIEIIRSYKSSETGEVECAYLANELNDVKFLITDDIKALEKLEKLCSKKTRFSTIIIFALYYKGKITKKQVTVIIERMRVKRDWKDNIIFEQAKLLSDELE